MPSPNSIKVINLTTGEVASNLNVMFCRIFPIPAGAAAYSQRTTNVTWNGKPYRIEPRPNPPISI